MTTTTTTTTTRTIDIITARGTAFFTFQELLERCQAGYVPTLNRDNDDHAILASMLHFHGFSVFWTGEKPCSDVQTTPDYDGIRTAPDYNGIRTFRTPHNPRYRVRGMARITFASVVIC